MSLKRLLLAPAALALVPLVASAASATGSSGPALQWAAPVTSGGPPPLAYASAAYDGDQPSSLVLFGGLTANGTVSNTTWIWDGTRWSRPNTVEPPARELASMAFDPSLHKLILFGGQSADGTLLNDTWAWNGASWSEIDNPGAAAPTPREAAGLAYDQAGNLLLFGGTGYAQTTAPTTTTTIGLGGAPAASPVGTLTALSDTWEWTSTGWAQRAVTGPSARSGPALAFDSHDGTDVLFGGEATPAATGVARVLSDTWLWNGSKWTQAKPPTSPPGRFAAVADDFPLLGGALLVSGDGGSGDLGDAWLWAAGKWASATVQGGHAPRQGAAGAYDSGHDQLVVFGGAGGGGGTLGDTGLVGVAPPKTSPSTSTATTTTTLKRPTTTAPPHAATTTIPKAGAGTGGNTTTVPTRPTPAPTATFYLETRVTRVHRGSTLRLGGAGFAPGAAIQLTFHSTPALLGWATADGSGRFSKAVDVPAHAAPGVHHIVASGRDSSGVPTQLTTTVFVLAAAHHGISAATTGFLVGLALLIPVSAYLLMAGLGWRRQRAKMRLKAQ